MLIFTVDKSLPSFPRMSTRKKIFYQDVVSESDKTPCIKINKLLVFNMRSIAI